MGHLITKTLLLLFHSSNAICPRFSEKVCPNYEMVELVSNIRRTFCPGKALSNDLRQGIIDAIVQNGGDYISSVFLGNYSDVLEVTEVLKQSVPLMPLKRIQDVVETYCKVNGELREVRSAEPQDRNCCVVRCPGKERRLAL